jgi:tRNA threonylcarbamoyladenosine biosynthesis protein TsaB
VILAIDTTHQDGSIALLDKGEILEETLLHSEDGFGHVVFGDIERLLERHGRSIHDVECFASASGPGAFTGVRVGLACVKGLAEAAGKRVAAVSNLQALATFGIGPKRATVLDARRGEVYGGLYDAKLRAIAPEVVMGLGGWLRTLPEGPIELISSGFDALLPGLAEARFSRAILIEAPRALAGAIARIALVMLEEGRTLDPAEADANYVRRSDAELLWKDPLSSKLT